MRPEPDGQPPDRVDKFDLERQYYVGFSRAKRRLTLATSHPDPAFLPDRSLAIHEARGAT